MPRRHRRPIGPLPGQHAHYFGALPGWAADGGGPTGRAPLHRPFRRAALSFMRWQAHRGVLNALDASPSGSPWWRALNERLLRDGCEALALTAGLAGEPTSSAVHLWLDFIATPTARSWYRAHNASIVSGYLEHQALAVQRAAAALDAVRPGASGHLDQVLKREPALAGRGGAVDPRQLTTALLREEAARQIRERQQAQSRINRGRDGLEWER